MAVINGTPAGDTLVDTAADDQISGMAGNDVITVTSGRDTVDGGAGRDILVVDYRNLTTDVMNNGEMSFDNAGGNGTTAVQFDAVEAFNVRTGSGNDTIRTFVRDDFNNNIVISGNDRVVAGAGDDRVAGGNGNDTLFGGVGNDVIDGDGSLRGKFGGNLQDMTFSGDDLVFGEAGNDILHGGAGSDILDGGVGDDEIFGDGGIFRATDGSAIGGPSVQITPSVGNDLTSGNDTLFGGDGNDLLVGNAGNDMILGGAGNDTARQTITSDGSDAFDLGTGSDVVEILANANADVSSRIRVVFTSAEVGNGNALESGTMTNQDGGLAVRMQSEDYADGLVGPVSRFDDEGITFVATTTETFDVRDLVSGVSRGDLFEVVTLGTSGADTLTAVQADRPYYFNAGMGDDSVTGGNGADFLVGGAGNDALEGGLGNDSYLGGGGNDTVLQTVTSDGSDAADLGAGSDLVLISAEASAGVSTKVRLMFTSAEVGNGVALDANTLTNQDGGLAVRLQSENETDGLVGPVSRYDDEGITFVATGDETFDVRDLVSGVARGDLFEVVVLGTNAADTLTAIQAARPYYFNAGMGDDSVTGGNGADFLVGGAGNDSLTGGLGNDSFLGGGGTDQLFGEAGSDRLDGGDGGDTLSGGAEGDVLIGGIGADTIQGGDGNDNLNGGADADSLSGDAGNDTLIGGFGDDSLTGGAGNDKFAFSARGGDDRIEDFEDAGAAQDTIILSSLIGFSTIAEVMAATSQVGNDALIFIDADNSITIANVMAANIFDDITIV